MSRPTLKYTIRDIAQHAGVAVSTVSRVINNNDIKIKVSEKTKNRIFDTIRQFDYSPNINATRLTRDKTFIIGLEVPASPANSGTWHAFSDHTLTDSILGIEECITNTPYKLLILFRNREYMQNKEYLKLFKEKCIDGLITWGADYLDDYCSELYKYPVVFINTRPNTTEPYNYIGNDNYKASYEITEYVIGSGYHKFIYFEGPQVTSVCIERKAGFLDALKKHNIPIAEDHIFESGYTSTSAYGIMEKILQAGKLDFDAVVATTDNMAWGIRNAALAHGKKIPQDFTLTGGGNIDKFGEKFPLTTFRMDCVAMGKMAFEKLMTEIECGKIEKIQKQLVSELIIENSKRL